LKYCFWIAVRKRGNNTAKVDAILEMIDLKNHSNKMTNQLSGGQKQRVSFARAIVIEDLLLLDEPFGLWIVLRESKCKSYLRSILQKSRCFIDFCDTI
jgi:ABC-type nitrate/sulfonate/bicarbonate transport system ATPase subunit